MTDKQILAKKVHAIQVPILEAARSTFSDRELEDLRSIVRLSVEFDDYMQCVQLDAMDPDEAEYVSGSVFAAVDSFSIVSHAYRVLVGATGTQVTWASMSTLSSPRLLQETYLAMYREFCAETMFERQCRLLLDLFKLQLIFVSISFSW